VTDTILVTGGAGYIGSHTCKLLRQQGFEPVTVDNLSTGHASSVRWGPLVEADIRDTGALVAVMRLHRPAAVIHFAASAYVGESVMDPARYYSNNVVGTASVLAACREAGVSRLVFSSSCATYGIPDTLPISEDAPQRPISPYGRTKLIGEQMLDDHAAAYGLGFAALRYFNACGADPDGELGEWHDPETHIVPRAIMAASGLVSHLDLYGVDYPTPDGTCIRDYIHVADLARAHVLAARHLLNGGADLKLNLGSGSGASIRQLLAAVHAEIGRPVPVLVRPRRAGDPPALYADITRAAVELGFTPALSDLATIVRTAAPFFAAEHRRAG
jgi:UDP-arabinose 4-epimerase